MNAQVNVEVTSFNDLMENLTYPIAIDSYQRPYVWDENQIEDLAEDLKKYLHEPRGLSYYMGSILLHDGVDSKDNINKLFIIDGQQRITTLTILYYVLYRKFPNTDKMGLSYNSPFSVTQIQQAKDIFEKEKHFLKFDAMKKILFDNIHFTVIKTNSEDLAFTFFDTQNNRGVKLSATDLLKAYHLRAINNEYKELQVSCAQKWEEIQKSKKIFPRSNDFVAELFEKFIWRSRSWKGQNVLERENDDTILNSFQKPTLETESNSIPLYSNSNNQLARTLEVDKNNHFILKTNDIVLTANSSCLPFTLRQPISKGLGFFLFTQKYANLTQKLIYDNLVASEYELNAFRKFYHEVFDHISIYLKELFLLCVIVYYDKHGSTRLLEFTLWLDHLIGAIRLEKHYIFWQASIKFLKENPQNLIDVISTSFISDEPIEYMKTEALKIKIYESEKIIIDKGVQGKYKKHLLVYFNKYNANELNTLKDKRDWITEQFIEEKLVCQK